MIDSFRFLPRSFVPMYENPVPLPGEEAEVWAPLPRRLAEARIALVTSAGLYLEGEQEPFDVERERREPTWGDPTHRVLPASLAGRTAGSTAAQAPALGMTHLHVNPDDILADPEIALPLEGLVAQVTEGRVGFAAPSHYSVMGFQEAGLAAWREETAPAIVARLTDEAVDGVILAPV